MGNWPPQPRHADWLKERNLGTESTGSLPGSLVPPVKTWELAAKVWLSCHTVLWRNPVRKRLAGIVSLTPRPQIWKLGLGNFDLGDDDFKIKHMSPLPNVKRVDYDARARCKGSRQGREVVTLLRIRLRWTLPACAPTPTDAVTPRGITSGLEIVDPEC